MNDIETLRHAKNYIDRMANGVNPLTGEPAGNDDMINNVRISRCLFYVSDILRQVIENGGTVSGRRSSGTSRKRGRFYINDEQRLDLTPVPDPVYAKDIAAEVNRVTAENGTVKFAAQWVTEWLVSIGMLEVIDGKKRATEQGNEIGITTEERVSPNIGTYYATLYSPGAQGFVYDNIDAIIAYKYSES